MIFSPPFPSLPFPSHLLTRYALSRLSRKATKPFDNAILGLPDLINPGPCPGSLILNISPQNQERTRVAMNPFERCFWHGVARVLGYLRRWGGVVLLVGFIVHIASPIIIII